MPLDLSTLSLGQIGHISVGSNVHLLLSSLEQLGGAVVLSGDGAITGTGNTLLFEGITQASTLTATNSDGSIIRGASRVESITASDGTSLIIGNDGNNYIQGTHASEVIVGGGGADIIKGSDGNDTIFGDLKVFSSGTTANASDEVVAESGVIANELVNGLGGVAGFGEGVLHVNDDGYTSPIDITPVFGESGLDFFGTNYNSLYVNNNGNITFSSGLSTYTPGVISAGTNMPIIAPFWADVDTRGSAPNTPTLGGTSTGSNRVWYDLDEVNGVFTVTWDDVGYYSGRTDKLNAFQLQLIDQGEGQFDIVYRYEDINWTTGNASGGSGGLGGTIARAGYSAGNSYDYYELPASGNQGAILALDETGPYSFHVTNGIALEDTDDDTITGGKGNDIVIGGEGDRDVAVFSGNFGEYDVLTEGNMIRVVDKVALRDGIDTLFSDVEVMRFLDDDIETAPYFVQEMVSTVDILHSIDNLSLSQTALDTNGTAAVIETEGTGGYYKLFFALSSAAYVHVDELNDYPGMYESSNNFGEKTLDYLKASGLVALDYSDFESYDFQETGDVKFRDGYFVSIGTEPVSLSIDVNSEAALPNIVQGFVGFDLASSANELSGDLETVSVATVYRSEDALFLTFRGTDSLADAYDDAFDMQGHYDRYSPLFDAVEGYVSDSNNRVETIYVSGHSLGGQMAMMYMARHPDSNVNYEAVTFEAANKLNEAGNPLVDFTGDQRFLNFEINGDHVPDLGVLTSSDVVRGNYGLTIHMNYQDAPFGSSHKMGYLATGFDSVAQTIEGLTVDDDIRLYVDQKNEGLIETEVLSTLMLSSLIPPDLLSDSIDNAVYLEVIRSNEVYFRGGLNRLAEFQANGNATNIVEAVQKIAVEDQGELLLSGYDISFSWGNNSSDNGTLILNQFPNSSGTEEYIVPQSDVRAVVASNNRGVTADDFDINASDADKGVIVIGNDGANKLFGSSHADILVGSGKKDFLFGGDGDDFLYGSDYSDVRLLAPVNDFNLTSAGIHALTDSSSRNFIDDVSYLAGGLGKRHSIWLK